MIKSLITTLLCIIYPVEFENTTIPDGVDVKTIVKQLGDDDFHKREKATETLKKLNWQVHKELVLVARYHKDPEIKRRARFILDELYKLPDIKDYNPIYFLVTPNDNNEPFNEFEENGIKNYIKENGQPPVYFRSLIVHYYLYTVELHKQNYLDHEDYVLATRLMVQDLRKLGVTHKSIKSIVASMQNKRYIVILPYELPDFIKKGIKYENNRTSNK